MKLMKKRMVMFILLLLVFSLIWNSYCLADDESSETQSEASSSIVPEVPEGFGGAINRWINSEYAGKVHDYSYVKNGENKTAVALSMPPPEGGGSLLGDGNIRGDQDGRYYYYWTQVIGDEEYQFAIDLNIEATVKLEYPQGNVQTIPTSKVIATSGNRDFQVLLEDVTSTDNSYIFPPDIEIPKDEIGSYLTYQFDVSPGDCRILTVNYVAPKNEKPEKLEQPGNLPKVGTEQLKSAQKGEHYTPDSGEIFLFRWIKKGLEALKNYLKDILSRIFSFLIITIGDGLLDLVRHAVGQDVTLGSIIYGHCQKVTIDYWSVSPGDPTSIAGIIKNTVSGLYVRFRAIAILCYLVFLAYLGVRLLLTDRANSLEAVKDRLNVWFTGVIILLFFPLVMRYAFDISQIVIKAIENSGVTTTDTLGAVGDLQSGDMMQQIKNAAVANYSIPLAIVYVIMIVELTILVIVYYKRAFMMGFLITIFPIVCIKHMFDGINSQGRGKTLNVWTREYVVILLTQIVHAVVYAVLIEGASSAFVFNSSGGNGNVILYVLCVTFLFKAEEIAKNIFQVKSSAGLVDDPGTKVIAGVALAKQGAGAVSAMMPNFKQSKESKADSKAEESLNRKTTALENNNANRVSENNQTAQGGSTSTTPSTSGGTGSTPSGSPQITKESLFGSGNGGGSGSETSAPQPTPTSAPTPVTGEANNSDVAHNFQKAKLVLGKEAIKRRRGSRANRVIKGVLGYAAKTTARSVGMTVGVAAGLASGDLTKAAAYGIATSKAAGSLVSLGGTGVNYAGKKFTAAVMRHDIDNPTRQMERNLEKAGVDVEQLLNGEKSELIRQALKEYTSSLIEHGYDDGEIKYTITNESLNKTDSSD